MKIALNEDQVGYGVIVYLPDGRSDQEQPKKPVKTAKLRQIHPPSEYEKAPICIPLNDPICRIS